MKMSKYYADRLLHAIDLQRAGWSYDEIAECVGISKSATRVLRPVLNRFAKLDAHSYDVESWLEGNYLESMVALEYYIRYEGGRDRQLTSAAFAEEIGVHDLRLLRRMLRGLMANTDHRLCSYCDTYDLDTLTIR